MKLHITTIIAIGASLGLSSCTKFLEEDPKSTPTSPMYMLQDTVPNKSVPTLPNAPIGMKEEACVTTNSGQTTIILPKCGNSIMPLLKTVTQ